MTSLLMSDIVGQCSALIGDPSYATFTQLQVEDWVNQAIRDLSIHFPRYEEYQISTTLGEHYYDLETYAKGILSVEYPVGQNPPRFLTRKSLTDPIFWMKAGFYDFIKPNTSDSDTPPQLVISDYTPVGTDIVNIRLTRDHAPLLDPGDECTVLERHYHLIGLFVRWKAISERSTHESMDPSPLAMRAALMENATQKAENAYISALNRALAAETESSQVSWKMDRFDGGY